MTDEVWTWLMMTGIGAFVVGCGVGYLIRQFAFGGSAKEADLARELEQAQEALSTYKQDVRDQYEETADRFRNLNRSYAELHEHLAKSAVSLLGENAQPLLAAPEERQERAVDDVFVKEVGEVEEVEEAADPAAGDGADGEAKNQPLEVAAGDAAPDEAAGTSTKTVQQSA